MTRLDLEDPRRRSQQGWLVLNRKVGRGCTGRGDRMTFY